jgi:hypothetical protein
VPLDSRWHDACLAAPGRYLKQFAELAMPDRKKLRKSYPGSTVPDVTSFCISLPSNLRLESLKSLA